ncbi:MAG: hypothetical protein AABW41_00785 [Nanoarchaeota archaeon]
MKFTFNFEKKHLYILAGLFVIFGAIILAKAALNVDTTKPWHNLQQVSRSATSSISVDVDGDGTIDFAEQAESIQIAQDTNSIKGRQVYWDSTDTNKLCYNTDGTCTTTTATCPSEGNYIFNEDTDGATCSTQYCTTRCLTKVKCDGNNGDCAGTQINYNTGNCLSITCGSTISCRCSCALTFSRTYSQATLSGTKKCATFASTS